VSGIKEWKANLALDREEEQLYKRAGLVTLRRKGVQLFQYIYYKDQLPLSLPPEVSLPHYA
jgi:hypothetical protein